MITWHPYYCANFKPTPRVHYPNYFWNVFGFVLIAHFVCFLAFLFISPTTPPKINNTKVRVQTVKLEAHKETTSSLIALETPDSIAAIVPQETKPAIEETPPSQPTPAAKPENTAAPKKMPTAKPVKKPEIKKTAPVKPIAKNKPVETKTPPKPAPKNNLPSEQEKLEQERQQQLVAQAQASLAKVNQKMTSPKPSKEVSSSSLPSHIHSLLIENAPESPNLFSETEINYRDEIAHRLKFALHLPDQGDVKIRLTLNKGGKVVKVDILSSENAKNKQYIEKTIPTLSFPTWSSSFSEEGEYTFLITLTSD